MSLSAHRRDHKPVSELRTHADALIAEVQRTKRELVLTQSGENAAVIVDIAEYERIVEELALLRDIHVAEGQFSRGEGLTGEEARTRVLAALSG